MVLVLVVGVVALVVIAVNRRGSSSAALPPGQGRVVRVIDGDTVVVQLSSGEEHVRLIGIDTPETHKPGTPVECFGPEASARMSALLPAGTSVRLERDAEARDRYGRLLAYVFKASDGSMVERTMLDEGMAAPLAIAPNVAHRAEFDQAAAEAQQKGLGLWRACGGPHVAAAAPG
jgi:micrococcal nuclease